MLGDEPADYRTYIKIPEEFERKQEEQTVARTLSPWAGRICLALGLLVSVLVFFFKRLQVQPRTNSLEATVCLGTRGIARFLC